MTPLSSEISEQLVKLLGKALSGSKTLIRSVAIAGLSLAEFFLSLIDQGFITDIRHIKKSLLRKMDANADSAYAKAQKRLADATDAANRANLHKRNDAIARAYKKIALAKAAKTEAEAKAILEDAETRRLQAMAEAKARLLEAVAKLRTEEGDIFLDSENLKRLLKQALPPDDYENSKKEQ